MAWTKQQHSILWIVSGTSFMGTFLISSINIALPAIEKTFSLDAIMLSWIITSFLLATGMFLLPVGKWGDIWGHGKLFKIGLLFFTVSSIWCVIAPSGITLIVGRFLQGVGLAFSNTTGQALLVASFSSRNRGKVLGFTVAAVYLGLALGPFIGGILTQQMGWRSLFYIAVVLGIIFSIISFTYIEKDMISPHINKKIDNKGTFVFMLGLVALVYGASIIPAALGWTLMGGGITGLIVFWFIENRSINPMLETALFTRNKLFAYSNLAALINYTATFAIVFFLSLYLQKIQHLSPQNAGAIIISQPIMMALFSPIVGTMSDKIQPRYFATAGMSMCTIGLSALAFLSPETPIGIIIVILVWEGIGFALFSSPNMSTIMSSVDKSCYGQASGLASSMRVIGQIVSMAIVTIFFAFHFEDQSIRTLSQTTFMKAMKWGFLTFAFINLFGIYFSFTRGNIDRE